MVVDVNVESSEGVEGERKVDMCLVYQDCVKMRE